MQLFYFELQLAITTKQMNGRMNDTLVDGIPNTVCMSMMDACKGGRILPPKIAMIKPAAPNLASSPRPVRAIP